jgi:UDP-2,4-diacetamido-2,4,6-trideoxy-beta-L-altropyranose hydrolase
MKRVIFRCDASIQMGAGHIIRCIALADAFKQKGWSCAIAASAESKKTVPTLLSSGFSIISPEDLDEQPDSDLIVVDGYQYNKPYETSLRNKTKKLVVIDDLPDKPHDCDFLIDQTYGRAKDDYALLVPAHCVILAGAGYALVRPSFAKYRSQSLHRRAGGGVSRILIFLSGSDPNGVTLKALKAVVLLKKIPKIDVILQSSSPFHAEALILRNRYPDKIHLLENILNMAELMEQADLCIGAGGTANWERCCLGLPAIIIEIADNQKQIAANLADAGAIVNLGWHETLTPQEIALAIQALMNDPAQVMDMSAKSSKICDGLGAKRVTETIEAAFNS